jgi:hypothetical protein
MTHDIISSYFDKARAVLKAEHDSMVQKIKEQIGQGKQKTMSKI